MGTPNNIVVGVASENTVKVGAYGDVEGSAVDLGFTDGGIEINKTEDNLEIFVDQHKAKIGDRTVSEAVVLKCNMSESSMANLAVAFNQPVASVSSGTFTLGDNDDAGYRTVYFNCKGPGASGTLKITVHKAKVKGDSTMSYKKGEVTMVPVEIHAICDTTKTAGQRLLTFVNTGTDTTAPTVALTSPADGGTVTKDTSGTVVWTITEANEIDENSVVYGDTFSIINTTTPGSSTLEAGTIVYSASAKTVTFTPTSTWTASDTFQAIVTTGLKDVNGNALAATKIEQFSVTA